MSDQPYPPTTGRRTLRAGRGGRLRRAYRRLLIIAAVAAVVIVPFARYAAVGAADDPDAPTLLTGAAVITVAFVLVLAALITGHSAVNGDEVTVRRAAASAVLSRLAGVVGWLGALAVLATSGVQHLQGADGVLVEGIALAGASLVPAVCGDATHRMARRLIM